MHKKLANAFKRVNQNLASIRVFANWRDYLLAQIKRDNGETILETRTGLKIAIRHNKWDAIIIREQFIDKEYLARFKTPSGCTPIIVDIGSYIGDFALYCAHYLGAKVVAYEPTTENFEVLKKNLDLNPKLAGRIAAVNRGVASTPEVVANVEIIGREVHASSSLYENNEATEKRTFECDTIEEIFNKNGLDKVDLLKIDCEGGEYDIIPATPTKVLERVHSLVYEWHTIPGWEPRLESMEEKLKHAGFSLAYAGQIGYATRPCNNLVRES